MLAPWCHASQLSQALETAIQRFEAAGQRHGGTSPGSINSVFHAVVRRRAAEAGLELADLSAKVQDFPKLPVVVLKATALEATDRQDYASAVDMARKALVEC